MGGVQQQPQAMDGQLGGIGGACPPWMPQCQNMGGIGGGGGGGITSMNMPFFAGAPSAPGAPPAPNGGSTQFGGGSGDSRNWYDMQNQMYQNPVAQQVPPAVAAARQLMSQYTQSGAPDPTGRPTHSNYNTGGLYEGPREQQARWKAYDAQIQNQPWYAWANAGRGLPSNQMSWGDWQQRVHNGQ
jgi:hypothetical protein